MEKRNQATAGERIETIDILRGFALAGILYAHMVFWYTGAALPPGEYFKYDNTASEVAMAIFGALVFGKFFSVFSFLFGLSFFLHFKSKKTGSRYHKTFIWRMFLLFLIGMVHHILWRGDILTIYAVLGVILLLFRQLPDKLILMISLLLIINLPTHIFDLFKTPNAEVGFPMAEEAEKYYSLIQNEDLVTVIKENWRSWAAKIYYQLESGRLLMTFGYFLLGYYAGRKQIFRNIEDNILEFRWWNKTTSKAVLTLLSLGILMYLMDFVTLPELQIISQLQWPVSFLFSIFNACLTVFYLTGITLLFRNNSFKPVLKPLGSMGRMALTNYLLQTVFGLMIFYHFGLGLFDKTSPALNVLLAAFVFYLQLKFSQVWLEHFQQGPIEWLWKSLTYFRISPIKKQRKEKRKSVESI